MALLWQDDLEYMEYVADLIDTPEVQKLKEFSHHLVTTRFDHSVGVSYRSYRIAKARGLDARACARAGLLHDLFYYDCSEKDQVGGKGHNYEHPRIALANAEKLTELSDLERDIIVKHMWGATKDVPAYPESWIVTWMDKYSAICELSAGGNRFMLNRIKRLAAKPAFIRNMSI